MDKTIKNKITPKHLVFIGAGIYENSWDGVLSSFRNNNPFYKPKEEAFPNIFWELNNNDKVENTFGAEALSMCAMRRKFIAANLASFLFLGEELSDDLKGDAIERFNNWEDVLIEEYKKTIQEYKYFENIKNIFSGNEFGLISTNWNDSLSNYFKETDRILFLHGSAARHKSLILPTEFVLDYLMIDRLIRTHFTRCDFLKGLDSTSLMNLFSIPKIKNLSSELSSQIVKFLGKYLREELRAENERAFDWRLYCETITFVGIELNVYDAELSHLLLFSSLNKKRVCIINKKDTIEEVELCKKRIALLLGLDPKKVQYFDSKKLEANHHDEMNELRSFYI